MDKIKKRMLKRIGEYVSPDPGVLRKVFARGLSLYQELAFEKAAGVFSACADTDHLCRIFLERCNYFKTSPPPQDWDGAWESEI